MGHVLDRGEVGGRMIGSDAAFIVTEDHVHHPVEAVLNGPMTSDDRSDLVSEPDQRGEIEARFALDLVDEFAGALDHDDRFETGPIMAFLQPIDIMEDRVRPGFDTAVVAIDRLIAADMGILEAVGLLLGGKELDILAQRALIAFEGEDVIGLLVDDLLGNVARAAHGVDETIAPSITNMPRSAGIATISLDFSATLTCPSTRRWRAAKAETM